MTIDPVLRHVAEGLRLRRAEPTDCAGVMRILEAPNVYRNTLQLPDPSLSQWREKMAAADPRGFAAVAEVPLANADDGWDIVGHASLAPAGSSPRRQHVMTLGMSVRDDWQGHGIGSALLALLTDRADRWMHVLRIELIVFADNEAACALYRRHGFVLEGTHRAHALRDGVYADSLTMARLHPRPPVLPAAWA